MNWIRTKEGMPYPVSETIQQPHNVDLTLCRQGMVNRSCGKMSLGCTRTHYRVRPTSGRTSDLKQFVVSSSALSAARYMICPDARRFLCVEQFPHTLCVTYPVRICWSYPVSSALTFGGIVSFQVELENRIQWGGPIPIIRTKHPKTSPFTL